MSHAHLDAHLETDVPAVLAEADRLAGAGHGDEAVQLLTRANRAQSDPAIEARLVTLRHDAFASRALRPLESLPAEVTADGAGVPFAATDRDALSVETLRRGLARHGCVLVRGLIPRPRAEALAEGIDRALDAFDACAEESGPKAAPPWYVPFSPGSGTYRVGGRRKWVRASGGVWTADSPRMMFELTELIDDTGVGALIEAYLGERPALSANKCTLRRVPVDTNTNWHQDGAFLGREVRTLNMWLVLSPCGVDAPGLDIVPRRFDEVLPTGTEGALFDWSVSPDLVAEVAGDEVISPRFEPGDALLFDHLFLHRTGVTPGMTRERHAIETWFFGPSSYPDGQIPLAY
jgi:hypothetical protein